MSDFQPGPEALKLVEEFCKWMMIVQGGLLATYARWVTTGAISPTKRAKATTLIGFGGALVLASLRLGFLSDMAQRLDKADYISNLAISHTWPLSNIPMSWLGVPQHILFFVGVFGFAWSAWDLRRSPNDEK